MSVDGAKATAGLGKATSHASLLLRVLWAGGVLGFLVLFAYTTKKGVDPSAHDRYTRNIRALDALDAELDGQIMLSRQALVNHYDDIVNTLASMRRVYKELAIVPSFLDESERRSIGAQVRSSEAEVRIKTDAIEAFKSENAILRNSVRYFPVGALELRDRLATQPHNKDSSRLLNELLCTVLQFNTQPSDLLRERVKQDLDAVASSPVDPTTGEDINTVLLHARTVLDKRDRVDDLTNDIVKMPTRPRIDALDAAYSRSYQSALRAAEHRRVALFIIALAVVALVSTDIILHLRRVARASRAMSAQLAIANDLLLHEKAREKELHDLKSNFVSMTSHEFRTPLSVILSSTELLEAYSERWSPAKRADHFARIKDSIRTMSRLLESILVIGRSEMGRLSAARARLDLPAFCREFVSAALATLDSRHAIAADIPGDLGEAWVDEKLLTHILTNLFSNAVKYSPKGGTIRFEARRVGDEVCFVVADEGIGIASADLKHLYESFHRGSNVNDIPGSGIGLTVVKRAVDAHGGNIEVATKEGQGTTFTVSIHVAEPNSTRGGLAEDARSVEP
ncbi:MAG: DAHL domain-containing protein [Polyangiaceae bacterium]